MLYAKQMKDGEVIALLTYDFEPQFDDDSGVEIITAEEYNALLAEMQANQPAPDPEEISDAEALAIITGEEAIPDEEE